jgi:two-component system, OmpR family, sensor kinase
MTIRKRLTLWYAALLTVIIILFGAMTFIIMRVMMIDNIDQTLDETASLVAINSRLDEVPTFGSPNRIEIRLAPLDVFRASGVYVQAWLMDENGTPVLQGTSANVANLMSPLEPDALGRSIDHYSNVTIQGVNLRVLTKPLPLGERLVGNVQVAADLATVNKATELLLLIMVVSCGVAILGAGALSMWFSHRALKPIEDITLAADSIAGTNDLQTRLKWDGPQDELGRLVSVFNRMMARIEHLFSVQQRFVADISHELRTPLTTIQGNVELMKRYGADDISLDDIESESKRMGRLVNDLLMLARVDYGSMKVELYPVDLDEIVIESFDQCKTLAHNRDLHIKMGIFEKVRINGNPDRLRQLIHNLIGNAIKFTDDGGEIVIGLEQINDSAVFWVKDTGIGIPPEEMDRIFDRFYQSDPARTHNEGDFGLGLSISQWIVQAHGGKITVSSQPNQGTTFTVTIPVYQSPDNQNTNGNGQVTRPRIPIIRRGPESHHHTRSTTEKHLS